MISAIVDALWRRFTPPNVGVEAYRATSARGVGRIVAVDVAVAVAVAVGA
jgi:hypothetical protein